ncbi:UPF0058 family protein [Natrinema salinisoli]|uniref:UPF0058 family protein n=1 Tax=Natrinema salinisoli TaxID=2878535 RepID=UPI001CEFF725|nr:UPF0058 family protein [Natrinema salinisoli]
MRSQELIHFHALLLEVRAELEDGGDVPPDAFAAYDAQPVRPSHVHRRKEAHEKGIDLLLQGIDRSIRTLPPPEPAPRP